jgi:hypothetical protein
MNSALNRRRIGGWVIALLIEALIIFALLSLGQQSFGPPLSDSTLTTFTIGPDEPPKPEPERQTAKSEPKPEIERPIQPPPPPKPPKPPTPKPPVETVTPPSPNKGFIELSREDLAAGDIGKQGAKSGTKSAGAGAGPVIGPGQGPGGKPLYNAEWVREPTDAELAPYLAEARVRPQAGSALIMCRTIPNHRVDNCQSLGESPPGTGLARALRLASWQFLVRAPRVDNTPLLGVWVRIRFDFTKSAVEGGGAE